MTAGALPQAAMVFAAGLGTRMGALTRDRPKALIEVAGRPLVDHAIALVRGAGVPRVVVNTHAHAAMLEAHLAATAPEARISFEPGLLETGGGLRRALPLLAASPVFTLNADVLWRGPNPLAGLAAHWDAARMDALLCLIPRDAAEGHPGPGDFFRAADGRLTRRGAAAAADFVYGGAQIIATGALDDFPDGPFSLNLVWDRMRAAGRLHGHVYSGGWADIGTPDGLAQAEAGRGR